jgi:hypothetical protein
MSDYEGARARVKAYADAIRVAVDGDQIDAVGIVPLWQSDLDLLVQTPGTSNANINAGRIDELFARLDRLEEQMRPTAQQAAEAKLRLFEEAGMDNVRRMERAEAKVARVVTLRDRLVRMYVSGSAFHDVANSITKALDGPS